MNEKIHFHLFEKRFKENLIYSPEQQIQVLSVLTNVIISRMQESLQYSFSYPKQCAAL